jgi:hypothetical protein
VNTVVGEQILSDTLRTPRKDDIARQYTKAVDAVDQLLQRPNIFNLNAARSALGKLGLLADGPIINFMRKEQRTSHGESDKPKTIVTLREKYKDFFTARFVLGDDLAPLKEKAVEILEEYDRMLIRAELVQV